MHRLVRSVADTHNFNHNGPNAYIRVFSSNIILAEIKHYFISEILAHIYTLLICTHYISTIYIFFYIFLKLLI